MRDDQAGTVAVTISLTDDNPDRIPLGVVQVGRAGVQPGRQGAIFGRLDARGGYNFATFWRRISFSACYRG